MIRLWDITRSEIPFPPDRLNSLRIIQRNLRKQHSIWSYPKNAETANSFWTDSILVSENWRKAEGLIRCRKILKPENMTNRKSDGKNRLCWGTHGKTERLLLINLRNKNNPALQRTGYWEKKIFCLLRLNFIFQRLVKIVITVRYPFLIKRNFFTI